MKNIITKGGGYFLVTALAIMVFIFKPGVTAQESLPETVGRLEQDLARALERMTKLEALVADLTARLEEMSDSTVGSDGGAIPTTERPPTVASTEQGGLLVEVQSCSKTSNQVSCNLFMTSQEQDQDVCIALSRENIRAWGVGVDYRAISVSLGSQFGGSVCNKLIQGIPITSTVTMTADTSPGDTLARMDFTFQVGNQPYNASFTNIPVQ